MESLAPLKQLLPPLAVNVARAMKRLFVGKRAIEWEYIPDGWAVAQRDPLIKGWNAPGVLEACKANWSAFKQRLDTTSPLALSLEGTHFTGDDLSFHNTVMTYAYVLALAAHRKQSISLLDWGGGIGHYYLLSQRLLPGVHIDYHCKDLSILAKYGSCLFPDAHFYTDETCLARTYDLVLASSSLHYSEDWQRVLQGLTQATAGYLFITRLPIVTRTRSFVFVQRAYRYGYNTEYLGWCLNKEEFLHTAGTYGLKLIREFLIGEQPFIYRAPEQCQYRGFLFTST